MKHLLAGSIIIVAATLLYVFVIPTVAAKHYTVRLDQKLDTVAVALDNVAWGANLQLFTDPDVSLPERKTQLKNALNEATQAQDALKELAATNQLPKLPGSDLANDYQTAAVRQKQAQNLAKQGEQVLGEYQTLLTYLQAYTDMQTRLASYLDDLNSIYDFNTLDSSNNPMGANAKAVQADADKLQKLPIPSGFDTLKTEAIATFTQAASNFYKLNDGLRLNIETTIYSAVGQLEAVTYKNTVSDKNLLVTLASSSPTLRQLAELPEKAEIVQGH